MDERTDCTNPDTSNSFTPRLNGINPENFSSNKLRNRMRWKLAIGVSILLLVGIYLVGMIIKNIRETSQPLKMVEGLAIPSENLDLGEVWEANNVTLELPILNTSRRDVEVGKFISSCGCTEIRPSTLSIAPGETKKIFLTLDLTHRAASELGASRRPFRVAFYPLIQNTDQRESSKWELHGTIKSRVTLDTPTIHFGSQPICGEKPASQRLLATVHVPCKGLEVNVDPRVATVTVKRLAVNSDRFEVIIFNNPSLAPGNFHVDATIDVEESTGGRIMAVRLPIDGEMLPEVRLLPERILLAPKPVGEIAEATVTLQAPKEEEIAVDHIELDGDGVSATLADIKGIPTGRVYIIRQSMSKEGEHRSVVKFVVRRSNDKLSTIPVEVWSQAIQPKSNIK
jgi:hypothetical protein